MSLTVQKNLTLLSLGRVCTHASMLWSTAGAGGNPLGRTECSDASSGCAPLQCLAAWDWISGSDGEGPHSAHRVTPRTSSAVTRRKGTCNVTKKENEISRWWTAGDFRTDASIRRKQNQSRQKDSTYAVCVSFTCLQSSPAFSAYVLDFSTLLNGEKHLLPTEKLAMLLFI